MILWRISNYADLSGRGGLMAPGRWHEKGISIVYCTDHPSTALLEILVQVDADQLPEHFQLLKIFCPDDVQSSPPAIDASELPDTVKTRRAGMDWLRAAPSCLLKVPSAVMPEATNILINPQHPDAGRIIIEKAVRYSFDRRFFR
ncbi:MAG: RES family NAD+ phosphorylase [Shinella sp.]|nr:RES family NAD+ phosphorylase [Shinella sp.]